MRAYSSLRLAAMAMSQQSLPPVNQYTGSYTEDVDGDAVRLNAFDLESIGLKTIIYHLWGISVII